MDLRLKDMLSNTTQLMKKEDMVRLIGPDPEAFAELYTMAFSREMPLCWRSAWILDYMAEQYAWLAENYIETIWTKIPENHPDGVVRSILRMLTRYDIPEEYQGIATDLCLEWLSKESVPVAIKVHSMEIIKKIALIYPELRHEFITVLEEQSPKNSIGFKVRARMVIEEFKKS